MIRDRGEDGFFSRVVTVHPMAFAQRRIDLDAVHVVHEFPLRPLLARQGPAIPLLVAFKLVGILLATYRIARKEQVALIRATDPYLMGLMGAILARLLGIPLAISLHADYETVFASGQSGPSVRWRRLASRLPRFVLRRADMVMPISRLLASRAIARGVDPRRIRVIHHGVDTTRPTDDAIASVAAGLPGATSRHIVSSVARLAKETYAHHLVPIARELINRRKDVVFAIAGDGPEAESIRKAAMEANLGEQFLMLGFRPNDEVRALRAASSVSLALLGGFSLLEACAGGAPVVAYDVEWHSEVIQTGFNGYLVPEGDVQAAADHIEMLLNDRETAARIGSAAQQIVAEHYSKERSSAARQACYRELLEPRTA